MQFKHNDFSCEVDIFIHEADLIARFYDKEKEHEEEQICDLVIVDPGYGYICLKYKGGSGLMSGFLDENIFSTDDMVDQVLEFIYTISPQSLNAYVPYHIRRVKFTTYVEYNGEY